VLRVVTIRANWDYARCGAQHHYLLQAVAGRRVIGRAHGWFCPNAAFVLQKIELVKTHRRRGHGTSLINCLRAQARHHGCTSFRFSGVRRDNADAIRLYQSMDAVAADGDEYCVDYVIAPL
jgi:ribosomal protein S18 acetylase RimI-like enzyme